MIQKKMKITLLKRINNNIKKMNKIVKQMIVKKMNKII